MLTDLRYAIRALRKTPGFTAAAVLSLALAIGANTAIFSVASALLLHPLPYEDADRLVILWNRSPGLNITQDWFSTAQYFDVLNGHHGFEQLAIAIGGNYNLSGLRDPERIGVLRVSSNLLRMLGVRPAAGRIFAPADDTPGAPPAAILSYGAWTRRFGASPGALGRQLTLNGQTYTVVGVLPRWFSLPREVMPTLGGAEDAEILITLPLAASAATVRTREDYNILGKLRRGVAIPQAEAEMEAITARLRRDHPNFYPPNGGLTFGIVPLLEQVVGDSRRALGILIGAVGFVLLIACANVANLLLSRALARSREIAVRAALGANRARLVRQLLTEGLALASAGGVLGVVFSAWTLQWIRVLGPASVPRIREIAIDVPVLLFTLAISLAAGVLFGLAPALRASRLDLHAALKDGAAGAASMASVWGGGNQLRRLLVAGELALSVVLLIGAGLLLRSFARLIDVPPGFNPKGVLTLGVTMTGRKYANPQAVRDTYRALWDRIDRLPGVTASGATSVLPLSQMFSWGPITIEGRIPPPGENFINADQRIVAWNYFQAMQIPVKAGRVFREQDTPHAPRVAVIDERMAHDYWPNESAVGKRFHTGGVESKSPWITVVGVAGRVKQYTLDADDRIALYLPQTQFAVREMNVVVRSAGDPAALANAIRGELRSIDPDLPVYQVRTMDGRVSESLARRRFSLVLLAAFAALALALAAIGVYGVMSYLVSQGTRELGIRIALGATAGGIVGLVLRRGMEIALAGVVLGLIAAAVLTRVLQSLLYGVGDKDAVTFCAVAVGLIGVSFVACYVPARRAGRVDPMVSLRAE